MQTKKKIGLAFARVSLTRPGTGVTKRWLVSDRKELDIDFFSQARLQAIG